MSKAPLLGTPKQISSDASESSTAFTMFGRFALPEKLVLAVISIGVIIGGFGQSVSLPLYLSTFGDLVGAYFVLWFCSFFFTIFFAMVAVPLYWKKAITPEMTDKKWIRYMVLVGLFDSLNGFTAVYSAFLGRVPGALTTVLMQFTLPLTIIWSKVIIRKVYTRYQYLGALFVMLGIGVSLVPVFLTFSNKENFHSQTWWWPFITILSTFFGALMNVVQELMQKRFREETGQNFSVFYYQAVESFFQWAFMTALCWVDIIPGFGLNHTFAETWKSFDFDWTCFLGFSSAIHTDARCLYAGGMGLLFISCYIISYIFGTAMTLHGSANLSAIVGAISPIMTVVFWVSFPKVNAWGGGSPYTTLAIWCNVGALVPIIVGIILYQFRVQETDTHGADASSPDFTGKKNKELCW